MADHARVEDHVPREDRPEVVVRGRDDHPLGPAEVEHQHHQAAGEQRDAQQARQRRARLVGRLAEHRADRGHVQHARGGDDHEDREHVRQAPDHLVRHAGDDVAVQLHVVRGAQAERRDERRRGRRAARSCERWRASSSQLLHRASRDPRRMKPGHLVGQAFGNPSRSWRARAKPVGRSTPLMSPEPGCARLSSFTSLRRPPDALGGTACVPWPSNSHGRCRIGTAGRSAE